MENQEQTKEIKKEKKFLNKRKIRPEKSPKKEKSEPKLKETEFYKDTVDKYKKLHTNCCGLTQKGNVSLKDEKKKIKKEKRKKFKKETKNGSKLDFLKVLLLIS